MESPRSDLDWIHRRPREFRFQCVEQAAPGLALEARETTLEASPPLAIGAWRDRAKPIGMAKFGERLAREIRRAIRLAGAVFVVNGQLLVRFEAFA